MANVSLDETYGAALIGVLVNVGLYGATTSQTYTYYSNYPHDKKRNKVIVGAVWVFDTLQTSLAARAMYYYLISNVATIAAQDRAHWSLLISVLFNRFVAFIAQAYFTHITFQVSPPRFRWALGLLISTFVIAHAGFGITFVVLCFVWGGLYSRIEEMNRYAATPAVIVGVIAEFMIAGSLCLFLKTKETSFRGTRKIIRVLILYAVNRCLLSSVFLTLEVAMMGSKPSTFYYMAIEFIVGKFYVASILATLNARPVESTAHRTPMNRTAGHMLDTRLTWVAEPGKSQIRAASTEEDPSISKETRFTPFSSPKRPAEPLGVRVTIHEQVNVV